MPALTPTQIISELDHSRDFFIGSLDPKRVAREWAWVGNMDELRAWMNARCFSGGIAKLLADAGVGPAEASRRIVRGGVEDTIAYWASNGDLSVAAVVRENYSEGLDERDS